MDWIALAVQVPLVGVFIWFSLENQKRFLEALDRRDEAYEKRNLAIVEALEKVSVQIAQLTTQTCTDHASLLEAVRVPASDEPKTARRPGR